MEGNENDFRCEKIFDAPKNTYKSNVWHYFGFFKREGELDKTHVICKQCRMAIKYAGNTTNLATHMKRRHGVDTSAAAPPSSPSDSTETPDTPSGSKACDKNSRSITNLCGQNTSLAANCACSQAIIMAYLFCKDTQLRLQTPPPRYFSVQFIVKFTHYIFTPRRQDYSF